MKKLTALLLVLVLVTALFAGCARPADAEKVSGAYEGYKVKRGDSFLSMDDVGKQLDMDFGMTMLFREDGTGTYTEVAGDAYTYDFTWKQDGNTVTINNGSGDQKIEISGNDLILDIGTGYLYLHRPGEAAVIDEPTETAEPEQTDEFAETEDSGEAEDSEG